MRGLPIRAILALLHLYIGVRLLLVAAPPGRVLGALALVLLYGLLVASIAPIFSRRTDHPLRLWSGLVAMGFFSSLLVLTFVRDVVLAAAAVATLSHLAPGMQALALDSAAAVPLLAALATLVGFYQARRLPPVREVSVPIAGLPAALQGLSIVQISDVHVGPTIRRAFVQRIVDAINRLEPDIIAVTGDSVDGQVADLREQIAPFADLRARHGVYAVTGNHEYYSGATAWVAEFERLGLRVLMNEHVVLRQGGAALVFAGVADYHADHFDPSHKSDATKAMHGAPAEATARVLMAHQPRSADGAVAAGFDLQLSGHTHGGQFWPWNLFVPLQQPFTSGLHKLGAMWVYTSRGTGYWGPPMRLGAPSEITRLRLVAA